MRVSLRDRFRSSTALAATEDPLVRLGAAYHLSRQPDSEMVRQQLLRLLESQDQNKLLSNHIETIVFSPPKPAISESGPGIAVRAFSIAGASKTRLGPKRLNASTVDPKIPEE